MIFAVDFDGTIVRRQAFDDPTWPTLIPGAREALLALKRAGHILLLWSARNNRSLMYRPDFDALVRAGVVGDASTDETRQLHADRWRQMVAFVEQELPGIFDAIDDGRTGKVEVDAYIDDRAIAFGGGNGATWADISRVYGE